MRMNKYTESDKCENKVGIVGPNGERKQARGSKRAMLLNGAAVLLALLAPVMSASKAKAETCTASPDCKSLGYTESSCSDGGVKCPWGNYWFCATKCEKQPPCMNCYVGWILNSDLTCSGDKVSGKTPIGVVLQQTIQTVGITTKCQAIAAALSDLSGKMAWSDGGSQCNNYSAGGITGWRLPTKDELLTVYSNINSVQSGLTKAGGTQFISNNYWTSTMFYNYDGTTRRKYINPVTGSTGQDYEENSYFVRPVLTITDEYSGV